jgi:endogenous inhibitor of DNA gyrase (YacG/DUF329 family)
MGYQSNHEPRRQWNAERHRGRVPCASCGASAHAHSAELQFCNTCLDRARQSNLDEWDELGAGD